jgi:hypothetical protein
MARAASSGLSECRRQGACPQARGLCRGTRLTHAATIAAQDWPVTSAHGMPPNRYRGPPMTLGNMRVNGVRSLSVRCLICHHQAVLAVDEWPDHVRVPAFGRRMVCTGCGIIGADARPNWASPRIIQMDQDTGAEGLYSRRAGQEPRSWS